MRIIKVKNLPFDSFMYIVTEDEQNCLIIDLGADFSVADEVLKREKLTAKAVLLTHNHFDHVCGAKSARDKGVPVYISTDDAKGLESAEGTLAELVGVKYNPVFDYSIFNEGEHVFAGVKVRIINTPGHTAGSVVFVIGNDIFSGDTLFYRTTGRTDLPSGSETDMILSVNRLIALFLQTKTNYKVHPGHGKETDLAGEYANNPFYLRNAEN